MKSILIALFLIEQLAVGQRLPLDSLGEPFALKEGRIEWSATNTLPTTMPAASCSAALVS